MVLNDLGKKITESLRKLGNSTVIDDETVDAMVKEIAAALLQSDVSVKIVKSIRDQIKKLINLEELPTGLNRRKHIQMVVFEQLCNLLADPNSVPYRPIKGKQNIIMFVGLQGSGKTTTCTKYAHYYQRKGWKTALVCADTFRAGAFDQLKQNALAAKIPFYGSYTETNPVRLAEDGVKKFKSEGYELIIVDTSGRHRQEADLFEEMIQVEKAVNPSDVVFVMDSSIGQAAYDQALAFRNTVSVGSIIVTKLDGHAKGGGAMSAVAATKCPIIFIGTGEHREDFEVFEVKGFVSRLLGMGDIASLMEKFKDIGLDKQEQLAEKLSKGEFSLRDFYDQYQNILKMGPLSQVMSMLPGGLSDLIPPGSEKEGTKRIKGFLCIMDSMTADELDCVVQMNPSRLTRVARGSGHPLVVVQMMMEEYKRFSKMISKWGKLKLGKNMANEEQMMKNMNPATIQKMLPPGLLKQMGGAGGIQQMMKQMAGNMPGLGGLGGLMGGK